MDLPPKNGDLPQQSVNSREGNTWIPHENHRGPPESSAEAEPPAPKAEEDAAQATADVDINMTSV